MTSLIVNPHIYKKGKILEFKPLNEENTEEIAYAFFGAKPANLTTIAHLGNNLNQLTGRCLLGILKLLSYFGLSKDPSSLFSKNPRLHGDFFTFFKEGDDKILCELLTIEDLLISQNAKLERIEDKINHLNPNRTENTPISRTEVLNFTSKLNEIEEHLKKILG